MPVFLKINVCHEEDVFLHNCHHDTIQHLFYILTSGGRVFLESLFKGCVRALLMCTKQIKTDHLGSVSNEL